MTGTTGVLGDDGSRREPVLPVYARRMELQSAADLSHDAVDYGEAQAVARCRRAAALEAMAKQGKLFRSKYGAGARHLEQVVAYDDINRPAADAVLIGVLDQVPDDDLESTELECPTIPC